MKQVNFAGDFSFCSFTTVWSFKIIVINISIQIILQLLQGFIDFLSEGDSIELIMNSLIQFFHTAVGPGMSDFGVFVFDFIELQ